MRNKARPYQSPELALGASGHAPDAGNMRISRGYIQLHFARQLDDGFGMAAVLEQRVFDGFGAVDEQAAKQAVLLAGNPVAVPVSADKDHIGRGRVTRWRFDKLHVHSPSRDFDMCTRQRQPPSRSVLEDVRKIVDSEHA